MAYLVNQYPAISTTFIRREIHALERLGHSVIRYGIRRPWVQVVDPEDKREEARTRYVLDLPIYALLGSVVATAVSHPIRFFAAIRLAMSFYWSAGSLFRHLVYLAEATVIKRWSDRDKIAHLHAHFGTNSTTVATLCRHLGGPKFSFTVHGPEEFDRPVQLGLGKKIASCEFVVGVSRFGCSQLYRWADFADWSKIHRVRCGLDESYFDVAWTPPPSSPRFLAIGRLNEQKGMPLLIQAAAKLARDAVSFELTIVGDGPLRSTLEKMIQEHQLQSCVVLAGWKTGSEIQTMIQQSRVLVMPSFAEGLPVACMESLALGRPVIATAVAGIPELVRSGVTGWLIPAGSVTALCRGMTQAMEVSDEEIIRRGKNGAARVRQCHDVRREAKKLSNRILGLPASDKRIPSVDKSHHDPRPKVFPDETTPPAFVSTKST
ncbi:glycosyl transferase group 1 family protein [Rhodopirellula maiorica SM1]|uniref:Glycosyl transferase group 1 family protein n=1 Tax=Rhodopirellula maiorica SM1 TaxID=1265738 RepID=M5RN36_9BACT|nr:glycosyl transferase group 1 family protein [Rhodopirellula maiorica SM1]